jgi:hypothetical protein
MRLPRQFLSDCGAIAEFRQSQVPKPTLFASGSVVSQIIPLEHLQKTITAARAKQLVTTHSDKFSL